MDVLSGVVPGHIGIIADGIGRWAEQRGLGRAEAERAGAEAVMEAVRACAALGVGHLTVFTPRGGQPMDWPGGDVARDSLKELSSLDVRLLRLGLREGLSEEVLRCFDEAEESTWGNGGMTLRIVLNYGGRKEIFEAALRAVEDSARGHEAGEVDEDSIRRNLYDPGMPDIDLLVRTGGEQRFSDFMLWHCAYAELYFTGLLWPDFRASHLDEALREFHDRERRFGAIKG